MYQDNQIGSSGSVKMKDIAIMAIRYYFIHDEIENECLTLRFVPTMKMVADMLTKPLNGPIFIYLRNRMFNI
jgi:hypothetical protein